ncbi:hypothetical protein DER46DRAFT_599924 [Fusarium sp. MPI-SDFR-AT-0072]|nr:hypothetical protein DER46DRAFT_599924 [Fusarium sp. MPI-SDFR-AT-0072]
MVDCKDTLCLWVMLSFLWSHTNGPQRADGFSTPLSLSLLLPWQPSSTITRERMMPCMNRLEFVDFLPAWLGWIGGFGGELTIADCTKN